MRWGSAVALRLASVPSTSVRACSTVRCSIRSASSAMTAVTDTPETDVMSAAQNKVRRKAASGRPVQHRFMSHSPYLLVHTSGTDTSSLSLPWMPGRGGLFLERAPAPQQVVVVLAEAVGLVADIFQQPQGIGIPLEPPRDWPAWANRRHWPSNAGGHAVARGGTRSQRKLLLLIKVATLSGCPT